MKALLIIAICLSLAGCIPHARWQRESAEADIAEQKAGILKAYRLCLEKYESEPALAKSNCEHYTQTLSSIDVRGLK